MPLVAAVQDSFSWLVTRLGPLATVTYVVPSLIATMVNCYRGKEALSTVELEGKATRLNYCIPKSPLPMPVYTSGCILAGDLQAPGVFRCLERIACHYGVEVGLPRISIFPSLISTSYLWPTLFIYIR